ncbi:MULTISPECIES: alpha/beta fold hydrolase [unclassified Knoellia]|uniref:alpha/beta fold hydrolase n=1 Tax=Knoellia altitudinis TaxID=3404795 RepID=UPI003622D4AA
MTAGSRTTFATAYDRAGPKGALPVVLIHAGVADRRMWDAQWSALTSTHDAIRLDLRGFGDSDARPDGPVSHPQDVLDTLDELGIQRCHLVGASFGAGVAVESALLAPDRVESLLLAAPGGSLLAELTPDLQAFFDAERAALGAGDLDAAVEANITTWVAGPQRETADMDVRLCDDVRQMQRRAFEVTADWDDVEERELEPPTLERLADVRARTLVLVGGLDLDTVQDAARQVVKGVPGSRRVDWADVGHLPSMERPADFHTLVDTWL